MQSRWSLVLLILGTLSATAHAETLAVTGGTLIDVSRYGTSEKDIDDSVVLIENDRILAVGPAAEVVIPPNARRIDARGGYVVPGLIEGFGSLKTQGFANAWLYNGVTTVALNRGDSRRGDEFTADPSPRVFHNYVAIAAQIRHSALDDEELSMEQLAQARVNDAPLTREEITRTVEAIAASGDRTVLLHYDLWPAEIDWFVHEAKRLGVATYGELGRTSYPYAARAGVQVFIHSSRYLSALAPEELRLPYADLPFGPPAFAINDYVAALAPSGPELERYGRWLAEQGVVLMPNLVLAEHWGGVPKSNPWHAASAGLIRPEELHLPLDPKTLQMPLTPQTLALPEAQRQQALGRRRKWAETMRAMDARLRELGAHYIAASGSSAFGVLPGSGMVDEVIAMQRDLGMTPRQALATATSNYADALGWKGIGRIEPGNYADVLVLGQDPRRDAAAIRDIRVLIADGSVLDRPALLALERTLQNAPVSAIQREQQ